MIRFVIYPRFAAGADETDELLEKIADVLVAHHGRAESEDDDVKSILVVEDDGEDEPEAVEDLFALISRNARYIILPGGVGHEETA